MSSQTIARVQRVLATLLISGLALMLHAGPGLAAGKSEDSGTIPVTNHGVADSETLTVTAAVLERVVIAPDSPVVADGRTVQLSAVAHYSDGTTETVTDEATWASDTPSVATVESTGSDNPGLARALDAGTSTITATFNNVSETTVMTVTAPTLELVEVDDSYPAVDGTAATMVVGETVQLSATGTYSDASKQKLSTSIVWESSDLDVATVSETGLVTAVALGTAMVTVTAEEKSDVMQIVVFDPPTVAVADVTNLTNTSVTLNGVLGDMGSATSVTVSFVWGTAQGGSYANETEVQALTSAEAFSASLTGLTPGTAHYFRAKAIGGDTVVYGEGQSFTTTTLPPELTTVGATNVADVSANLNGSLDDLSGYQSVTVSFEWGLTEAYGKQTPAVVVTAAISFRHVISGLQPNTVYHYRAKGADGHGADRTFITLKELVSIAVGTEATSIAKGNTVQFTAIGTFSDGSTSDVTSSAVWSSSDPAVATIDHNGLATAQGQGQVVISASLSGTTAFFTVREQALVPAEFSLSDLVISPASVEVGGSVDASVTLANAGEAEGEYDIQLKLDGEALEARTVSLAGGASETFIFAMPTGDTGTFTVSIEGLTGSYSVTQEEEADPPPPEEVEQASTIRMPIIIAIAAGAVSFGTVVTSVLRRRRRGK